MPPACKATSQGKKASQVLDGEHGTTDYNNNGEQDDHFARKAFDVNKDSTGVALRTTCAHVQRREGYKCHLADHWPALVIRLTAPLETK